MEKINGQEKSLRALLESKKYILHYYQREYRWQRKHIQEMLEDLTAEFWEYHRSEHKREDVKKYGVYFMGSIVLAGDENAIIDGQQRLSSLTLLLMYLNNRQAYNIIDPMIFSEAFGTKSFNINVPERQACMTAIYENKLDTFDPTNASESVKNLCARYKDIQELFPSKITDEVIPYFCDWLAEKVFFMQILAATEQDAHKIFVTMNDRGLSLKPAEMLKGYLLSEINDNALREQLNELWRTKVLALEDTDAFIKDWLRAQYAENTKDYEAIGKAFHKWIRDNHKKLNLNTSTDYEQFIRNFLTFAEIYGQIRHAEKNFSVTTKYIFYNAQLTFTMQPQMLMAPICPGDDATTVTQKINLAARFIDLMIVARVTNYKRVERNNIENYISGLTKDIRRMSVDELKVALKNRYEELDYNPVDAIPNLRLNSFTRRYLKSILARITSFIEEKTSGTPRYVEYIRSKTRNDFEIEHIICDHFERFTKDFADKNEFDDWRDNIGALLLLRRSINASLSDSDYPQKLVKYCSTDGNIYAASLGAQTYRNNPRFRRFVDENNLSFEPFDKFGKTQIQKRIRLIVQLVNLIWNTEDFE